MRILFHSGLALLATVLCSMSLCAHADTLRLQIVDQQGKPLEDAVAWAMPLHKALPPPAAKSPEIVIDQIKRHFVPMVSVARVGTFVRFPNKDNFEHDVYSFSPAKTFHLNLYHGEAAQPLQFDKAGLVVMGCSIHDTMLAYLVLVDTPYFAKSSADGALQIDKVPGDTYNVTVWHPGVDFQGEPTTLTLASDATTPAKVTLTMKAN